MEAWRLGGPEAERDRGKKGSEGLEGHLGINWASFCVILGDLGSFGDHFGLMLSDLGLIWGPLGVIWSHLGTLGGHLGPLGVIWGSLGTLRGHLEVVLGSFGGHLG